MPYLKNHSDKQVEGLLASSPSTFVDVWTKQSADIWQKQVKDGYIYATWGDKDSFGELDGDCIAAYKWMQQTMMDKIEDYSGHAPIWCWLKKPNWRGFVKQITNEISGMYIIHARIPKSRMILSCYDTWHCCLNNWPIVSMADYDAKEEFYKIKENREATWHRVLEFRSDKLSYEYRSRKGHTVQACVDRVGLHEIQSCSIIRGRKLYPVNVRDCYEQRRILER